MKGRIVIIVKYFGQTRSFAKLFVLRSTEDQNDVAVVTQTSKDDAGFIYHACFCGESECRDINYLQREEISKELGVELWGKIKGKGSDQLHRMQKTDGEIKKFLEEQESSPGRRYSFWLREAETITKYTVSKVEAQIARLRKELENAEKELVRAKEKIEAARAKAGDKPSVPLLMLETLIEK